MIDLRSDAWRRVTRALMLCALCTIAMSPVKAADAAGDATGFSEAETRLWLGDQLKAVTAPLVLEYAFEKSGTYEAGFSDRVVFTVHELKPDGMKSASLQFFTGERNFPVPPEERTNVNPVLKVYFQGDVYEMNRLTDPDGVARERWRYFQRRIKFALADTAKVEPVTFEFDGRPYAGHKISFAPYLDDPKSDKFKDFIGKTYTVIVSDELPGYVYRIETEVPGKTAGAPPLMRESLWLTAIRPYAPPRAGTAN
ncbi:MAG: hypothetical protein AB7Q76_10275 [Gammaproteobacteria bacterium]